MDNPHRLENAANIGRLDETFVSALQQAWCHATCWNGCKDGYWRANPALNPAVDTMTVGAQNPSFGNCFVSTLAAWGARGFGDDVVPALVYEPGVARPVWHFFLEIDGGDRKIQVDPTRQQFIPGYRVEEVRPGHPRHHEILYFSIFDPEESASLHERLGLLLERMAQGGCRVPVTAAQIIGRLELRFAYAQQKPGPVGVATGPAP